MNRENSSRRSSIRPLVAYLTRGRTSALSSRLPLVALLAANSLAGALACSSDDDGTTSETLPLESVEPNTVPERNLPPAPEPAPTPAPMPEPLPPGSDTLNGLSLPDDILDWRVIGVVNVLARDPAPQTLRVIVGNDIAVEAARSGQTNPWPNGSMISHYQWSPAPNPDSATTTAPDDFLRLTLMVKDTSEEFTADGNWRYGVWGGNELRPLNNPMFDRDCVDCHMRELPPDSGKDYVFTIPGVLPEQAAVEAAAAAPNGIELPAGILDWRVIGVASREKDAMNPSIRVIVGNDTAVEAARSGETNPWPDGSMLAHYVWAPGDNVEAPNTVNPVSFNNLTLMVKNAGDYADDGGWAYGAWGTLDLTPPAAGFDRQCVMCHINSVGPDNDYVFTRPGALPTDMFPTAAQ